MFCDFCDALSVSVLVEKAKLEFHGSNGFPQHEYCVHQPSYLDLIQSAEKGCSLCRLIFCGGQRIIGPYLGSMYEGMTREEVALQIAADGEPSDIRISINAASLWGGDRLAKVEMFDELAIQIGVPEPLASSEPSEGNFIPPFCLALSVPRGVHATVGGYRIGRYQLDAEMDSQTNYRLATDWINHCSSHHTSCPEVEAKPLPTRAIDVGSSTGPQTLRVMLSEGSKAKYAALSHCWGGEITTKLRKGDPDAFQEGIVLEALPANFRDAISITRGLGIQYLWIDSLCIVQDSTEDWEHESQHMGSIYRNAVVTISVAMSARSTEGIFKRVTGSQKVLDSVLISLDHTKESKVTVSLKDEDEESFTSMRLKSPLAKRAWTLQETVLSPRILLYGERQIYWQCSEGYQSADGISSGHLVPEESILPTISKLLHSNLPDEPAVVDGTVLRLILDDYYDMVKNYSGRSLTYKSDKFPAFSGIVALLQPFLGYQYLAGIWSGDFLQGLLWYREVEQCRHDLSDHAPSWSWAVTSDPVLFNFPTRQDAMDSLNARLVSYHVEPKSEKNKYGRVGMSHLVVDCFTKKLFRSRQAMAFKSNTSRTGIYYDEAETMHQRHSVIEIGNETGNSFLSVCDPYSTCDRDKVPLLDIDDVNWDLVSGEEYVVCLVRSDVLDLGGVTGRSAACLILLNMGEENTYSRVGYLCTEAWYFDRFETWMQEWERKTIKVI